MNWFNRLRRIQSVPSTGAAPVQGQVLAGLTGQFADAGVEDSERLARRAAAAGLEPDHIKTTATARYIIFRAHDADRAKRFLLDDLIVDKRLTYFIVETPEGNWGTDIDGLFLENLLPWQRDVDAAEYTAPIITVPSVGNPSGGFISASKGTVDNYTVELECGRCQTHWWDGIRYRDLTAVRCPACRSRNRVDSHDYVVTHYLAPSPEESPVNSSPYDPATQPAPLTGAEIAEPGKIGQRLVDLLESTFDSTAETTRAQHDLRMDRDYLDTKLASGEPLDTWLCAHAEVRAIGFHLDRVGGITLMRHVHDTLNPAEHRSAVVLVSYLWHRIGQWRD
ncbi:hypothetical protein [Nocardia aurea]|uniref:hypothetical protein n=1 Tax=Nocardia aurea TaxID=2144174 RepID=UPI0033AFC34A